MALIDKKSIKKFIADGLNSGEFGHDAVKILAEIEYMPTVDAEPVRNGRWVDEYDGKYANPRYICSNCKGKALYDFERDALGNYSEVQVLTEHCPNCGAKMDEVK